MTMPVAHQVCGTPRTAADISRQSQVQGWEWDVPLPAWSLQSTALALQCLLSGSWQSDTSSRMVVFTLDKDNRFSGFYLLGPAAGNSELHTSPLEGSQQDTELSPQPMFSFTVNWQLRGRQQGDASRTRGDLVPHCLTHITLNPSRFRDCPDKCLPGPVLCGHQRGGDPACPVAPARGS